MLWCQPVIHVECNQLTIELVHNSLAEIMVDAQSAKDPSSAVEVDIGCSLLRLASTVHLECRLKYTNSDHTPFDGTFLLCNAENIRSISAAIRDGVSRRILSKLFYRHFVRMETPGVVLVVVLHVDGVEPRYQFWRNAIVKWLMDFRGTELM